MSLAGIQARPGPQEEAAARQRHIAPVVAQVQHLQAACGNPELRATDLNSAPMVGFASPP